MQTMSVKQFRESLSPSKRSRFLWQTTGLACLIALVSATHSWRDDVLADSGAAAPSDATAPDEIKSPLSPEQSLQQLKIATGLRVELAAAEPLVIDPVALAFDEDGRLWVVEMTDYPNGPVLGEAPRSRIRLLEDLDGDGQFETARVFAEKLLFATGVQPWRGGVIVTLAGEIVYFKDTDGDGRADVRETWFRGFAQENPQLRANHPRFGLDNRIYVANGLRGGTIVAAAEKWGAETPALTLGGMDFRFNPHTGAHGTVSGMGQFGLAFDDYANRFFCTNRNPCRHIVLEDHYLKRNPFLGVRDAAADVSAAAADSRIFPLSRFWTTSTLHAGQFTAACGVNIYRGDLLPAEYRGNSFTCEPTGNLVHRDVLSAHGATFLARPSHAKAEFLASPDTWFRPVDLANGPDGALYVADMYRAVIEHPQWVPDELKERADLNDGNDRGRIYRIVPAKADQSTNEAKQKIPKLSQASATELVPLLAHPNAWHRETAARLIFERQDKSIVPALIALVQDDAQPLAQIQALWALDGLQALTEETLVRALSAGSPRVREQGVVLSEPLLKRSTILPQQVLALANDDDLRLTFQVALSLGELSPAETLLEPLAGMALRGAGDEWTRRAVLTSVPEQSHLLLGALLKLVDPAKLPAEHSLAHLVKELAEVVGSRQNPAEIAAALGPLVTWSAAATTTSAANQKHSLAIVLAGMNGLGQGAARRGASLAQIVDKLPPESAGLKQEVAEIFVEAVRLARDPEAGPLRQSALSLLEYAGFERAGEALLQLAKSDPSQPIQLRAIDILSTYHDPRIGELLLANFAMQTPAVRRAVVQALVRDRERTRLLLTEIAAKHIAITELDQLKIRELMNHADPALRAQAQELLAASLPADRKQVLEAYQPALALKAEPARGRAVFEKNCTTCHKIGNLGVDVAPDIADSRTKTPAGLLTDILHPNQAIDNNYLSYTITTADGKSLTGIISAETASSVTLRQPENKTAIVLRQDIEELRSNGISLMPEGLEKTISVEQMADLISFIKNWRYLEANIPIPLGGTR